MTDEVIDAPVDAGNPTDQPALEEKSLADGGGTDKPVTAPADWPEDWRAKMSGEDKDALKVFERYKSPADIGRALREAQKKISSGQMKPALPKNATEEDIAAYRKEIGVPEKAEGYLESLPNGLVIGDADKAMAESFLSAAHEKNMPPEFVGAALDWYYKTQEAQVAETQASDKAFRSETEDALRSEWGGEYRSNINALKNFLDAQPMYDEEAGISFGDLMRGARGPDGKLLGDNPAFLNWALTLANKENPAGFVPPAGGGSQVTSIEDEIASIAKVMRETPNKYYGDEKMQARYRQLIDAREKLKTKG